MNFFTDPGFETVNILNSASDAPSQQEQADFSGYQPSNNFNINASYVVNSNIVVTARYSRRYINEKLDSYDIANAPCCFCVFTGGGTSGGGQPWTAGYNSLLTNFAIIKNISNS